MSFIIDPLKKKGRRIIWDTEILFLASSCIIYLGPHIEKCSVITDYSSSIIRLSNL